MKNPRIIRLHLKDPDGVYDSLASIMTTQEELDKICNDLETWVEFDEYVSVEINLDTGETRVLTIEERDS